MTYVVKHWVHSSAIVSPGLQLKWMQLSQCNWQLDLTPLTRVGGGSSLYNGKMDRGVQSWVADSHPSQTRIVHPSRKHWWNYNPCHNFSALFLLKHTPGYQRVTIHIIGAAENTTLSRENRQKHSWGLHIPSTQIIAGAPTLVKS